MFELDIKLTKDGQFPVFHDWTLNCLANVKGIPSDYTLEALKQVDIGYDYTPENGKTYLDEVWNHFPTQSFLIHIKSNDYLEGEQLADFLTPHQSS